MRHYRNGHAPGHIRDAFTSAIEAFMGWNLGEPEPTVEVEFDYQPRQMPISKVCGLLWTCTDILPSLWYGTLTEDAQLWIKRQTYAAAARAMKANIRQTLASS